ncbi:MAG TPA: four-helix bundle copper-binding protein [Anaeromyxobacteraceae bacterium]|nr:four-helix bundle copper-binding protein [Anaeromyxobacteraceae bacterium]
MDVAGMIRAGPLQPLADTDVLAPAILEASRCAVSAALCADACLGEPAVEKMRLCIRLNLDAADLCQATARLLSRQTSPDLRVIRTVIEACLLAVEGCGDECERHAHLDHCRMCLEACRRTQEALSDLLGALPAVPDEPAASVGAPEVAAAPGAAAAAAGPASSDGAAH